MTKFLAITVILLAACGCSSVNGGSRYSNALNLQEERMTRTEQHILRLYYFQAHAECFTRYNYCRLSKSDKECWTPHEQCVINVDKQYRGKI